MREGPSDEASISLLNTYLSEILDLESPDPAAELLRALGVDSAEVRNRLDYSAP